MRHRSLALVIIMAFLAHAIVASAWFPLRPLAASPSSRQASEPGSSRQVVIFVPGINTKYDPDSSDPQTQGVPGFESLKAELIATQGYSQDDFIDFGYDASAYLDDGAIELRPYSCEQSGQDIALSGSSLRRLITNVHALYPNGTIALVGHSLGGVVITWALAGIQEESVAAAIAAVVTIDSPLYGARSADIERLHMAATEAATEIFSCSVLTDSPAALALDEDLGGYLRDGERSAVAQHLAGSLRRFHDRGARVGTFGNLYDCLFNHVACATVLAEISTRGLGLGTEDYSWTQVYPRGASPLGYSRMYEFPDYWPGCALIWVCVLESHGYLLEHPQPEILAAISPQIQPAAEVAGRALDAVEQAGTYRVQVFDLAQGGALVRIEAVNLAQGAAKTVSLVDGTVQYYIGTYTYTQSQGTWTTHDTGQPMRPVLLLFLQQLQDPSVGGTLQRTDSLDGQPAHVLAVTFSTPAGPAEWELWIDAQTLLPLKRVLLQGPHGERIEEVYADFGAPIDIQAPPEALLGAPTPTPDALASLAAVDPQTLVDLLLTTPFGADELPPGFASAEVGEPSAEQLLELGVVGQVGAVYVDVPISGGDSYIYYLVFASDADAVLNQDRIGEAFARYGYVPTGPVALDWPATALTGPGGGFSAGYGTVCIVQLGNVVILGGSALPGDAQAQTITNAVDLARSGVAHLQRVVGQHPSAPSPSSLQGQVASASVAIELGDQGFVPSEVTVPANANVTLTLANTGAMPHNLSIDALQLSVDVAPGETVRVVVNAPAGEYRYYCAVPGHAEGGEVGRLIAL